MMIEVLYTGSRQLKEALRLLYLIVHRADIPGKVVRLQRQADNEVAQGFWHGSHLLQNSILLDKTVGIAYNKRRE